jgi:hypothetical protein
VLLLLLLLQVVHCDLRRGNARSFRCEGSPDSVLAFISCHPVSSVTSLRSRQATHHVISQCCGIYINSMCEPCSYHCNFFLFSVSRNGKIQLFSKGVFPPVLKLWILGSQWRKADLR